MTILKIFINKYIKTKNIITYQNINYIYII